VDLSSKVHGAISLGLAAKPQAKKRGVPWRNRSWPNDMLRYSRKQQGVYRCNKDDDRQARLIVQKQAHFQKSRASSVIPKPHFRLTEKSTVKETNGYLDLVPDGKGFIQCVCHSPAHNLMCEQNSAHFWVLVLSLIWYGLRGGNEKQKDRLSFMQKNWTPIHSVERWMPFKRASEQFTYLFGDRVNKSGV